MIDIINQISSLNPTEAYSGQRGTADDRSVANDREPPRDRVSLSREGRESAAGIKDDTQLDEKEKQEVNRLKKRDIEVKAHEQAHMAAGGGIVQGGATYEYQRGPDGKQYAVGGEVQIDLSAENTPEGTIRKMQQVRRAALAPAQPSGTDRSVAAQASQIEAQARMERAEQNQETGETEDPAETDQGISSAAETDGQSEGPSSDNPFNGFFPAEPTRPNGSGIDLRA